MLTLKQFLRFFNLRRKKPVKRVMGRRKAIMRVLLTHKFLDLYEIAERSGMPVDAASKVLSSAFRDKEPIERIKRDVAVPNPKTRRTENVWCYRKRPALCDQVREQLEKEVEEMKQGDQQALPLQDEGLESIGL